MRFDWRFCLALSAFKGFIIAKNIIFLFLAFALYLWGK
ncbi:putative membrane protein [Helicobacter pylori R038b]|uniref:Putative membrane protein n=1 Tax=Helicobacter pylori R038b TaxID=1145115 RepID=K2KV43_HELPX|nr:putative membrane protein [Helicobacter pylori R038b]